MNLTPELKAELKGFNYLRSCDFFWKKTEKTYIRIYFEDGIIYKVLLTVTIIGKKYTASFYFESIEHAEQKAEQFYQAVKDL